MQRYRIIFTDVGLAKIANAQVTQEKLQITHMAIGDANDEPYRPTGHETALVNEVWRTEAIIKISDENDNWLEVEAVIPADIGGFTINEFGLYDVDGDLVAISNHPRTPKPSLADGSIMDLMISGVIKSSNADLIELTLDPTTITASTKYVDEEIVKISDTVDQNVTEITQQLAQIDEIKAEKTVVTTQLATKVSHDYFDSYMASVVDWAPKAAYTTLAALQAAYPNGASGVFLVQENGHAYSWMSGAWTDLGAYQGTQITNSSIAPNKLVDVIGGLGKNLFNKYDFESGKYIDGLGNLVNGTSSTGINSLSGLIPVEEDVFYTPSHEVVITFFDENRNLISSVFGEIARKTPVGTKYVKLSFKNADLSTLQFEKGGTSTSYEDWQFKIKNLKVEMELDDETLLSRHYSSTFSTGKNLFNKNDYSSGIYIDGTGQLQTGQSSSGLNSLSDFIPVKPNTTYSRNFQSIVVYYDFTYNQIGFSAYNNEPIVTPSNCKLVRVSFKSVDISTFQLEEGSVRTAYEPWIFKISGVSIENNDDKKVEYKDFANTLGAGKNLFNKDDYESNKYIDGVGQQKTGSSGSGLNSLSGFIQVQPLITYARSHQCIVVFYDNNKQQIGVSTYWTDNVTTPVNCYFAKLSFKGVDRDVLQFEKGNKTTEYEDWRFAIAGMTAQGLSDVQLAVREVKSDNLDNPGYIKPMLNDVAKKVMSLQTFNTLTFAYITDTHTRDEYLHHCHIAAEITKYAGCKFLMHGGDYFIGLTDLNKEQHLELLTKMSARFNESKVPVLHTKGDHDDNNFYARANGNLLTDYISNLDLYNRTIRFYEDEVVMGSKEDMYYYYDDPASKIRVIVVNTSDIPFEANPDGTAKYNCYVDKAYRNEQLNWIAHTALDFSDKANSSEWAVVISGHFTDGATVRNYNALRKIINAYKNGSTFVESSNQYYGGYDVNVDFSQQGTGEFICFLEGHWHLDGNVVDDMGLLTIRTLNAHPVAEYAYSPARVIDTETETAIDIFTINRAERKIYTTRFGAGADRVISY